ncbi:MAG TPA: XRE family transcriptional regulator [Stellaceae bacterium]|nr:XRE family transcriptional regulator [Stellaceae bacterium]
MRLEDYLAETGESCASFARRLRDPVSGEAVRRWARGERVPEGVAMAQIFDASGGKVTPNDFFGIVPAGDGA